MKLMDYFDDPRSPYMGTFAEVLGVKLPVLSRWVNGHAKVPAERCHAIERLTGKLVTIEELRPDINWSRHGGATDECPCARAAKISALKPKAPRKSAAKSSHSIQASA